MRIVVAGGTGLIGSALVGKLQNRGCDAIVAARSTGVNVYTGEGLTKVLEGADIVVDALNADVDDPHHMLDFFHQAGRKLLEGVKHAGVKHHIVLSAVGADRLSLSGFFLAKLMQENLARASGVPFTIVRSAPFFETIYGITTDADIAGKISLPPILIQPIAADDVANAMADAALSRPAYGALEVAGPETFQLTDLASEVLAAYEDPRQLVSDARAPYFGTEVGRDALIVEWPWRTAATRFDDWLRQNLAAA